MRQKIANMLAGLLKRSEKKRTASRNAAGKERKSSERPGLSMKKDLDTFIQLLDQNDKKAWAYLQEQGEKL